MILIIFNASFFRRFIWVLFFVFWLCLENLDEKLGWMTVGGKILKISTYNTPQNTEHIHETWNILPSLRYSLCLYSKFRMHLEVWSFFCSSFLCKFFILFFFFVIYFFSTFIPFWNNIFGICCKIRKWKIRWANVVRPSSTFFFLLNAFISFPLSLSNPWSYLCVDFLCFILLPIYMYIVLYRKKRIRTKTK